MSRFPETFRPKLTLLALFWQNLKSRRVFQRAAALSYTTLLALVPLLALILAILTAFPAFQEMSEAWQNALFEHLVPAARQEIQSHLREFAEKAKRLTAPGVLFLVVTVTLLMKAVEEALNDLWNTTPPASLKERLKNYWALLTLGPILVGGALLLTARLLPRVPEFFPVPILLEWSAFALLFKGVPNAPVRWRAAAIGGLSSALLFELAKFGFAIYLKFSAYQVIYGALAAVPIFLVWLYLTWLVCLSGAVLTYTLHLDHPGKTSNPWRLDLLFRLLREVWSCREAGCSTSRLLERLPELGPDGLAEALSHLREAGWLGLEEEGRWFLRKDPHTTTLLDLYRSFPVPLPPGGGSDPALRPLLQESEAFLEEKLKRPLSELFGESGDLGKDRLVYGESGERQVGLQSPSGQNARDPRPPERSVSQGAWENRGKNLGERP